MIYLLYLLTAGGVTLLSIKAADYVDALDKKTNLSGAFIGGVMLSAVTSLPELFSSISATLMLNEPGLCIGNILGSDLFNLMILAVLMLIFMKDFSKASCSTRHLVVLGLTAASFVGILLNWLGVLQMEFFSISVTSLILFVAYFISVRFLAGEDGEKSDDADNIPLTVKQIAIRFALVSVGIIVLSIAISYLTDGIADALGLGKGIAGALFMGIATSLPELSSTISLFKKRNYDIAVGNIVGSNIFNFFILAFTDLIYFGHGVYDFSDPKTINLMCFGLASSVLMFCALKAKNKAIKYPACALAVVCYVGFLVV